MKLDNVSNEAMRWLTNILETQASNYDYVFIVASDPLFSTRAAFGVYEGLDADKSNRDKLWDLLMKYNVRAYFSSGEVVYDRTYRRGGWQIITGGGGTPADYLRDIESTFYHFLLVTLPPDPSKNPQVSVFDQYGVSPDEFYLTKKPPLIYDYRISRQEY